MGLHFPLLSIAETVALFPKGTNLPNFPDSLRLGGLPSTPAPLPPHCRPTVNGPLLRSSRTLVAVMMTKYFGPYPPSPTIHTHTYYFHQTSFVFAQEDNLPFPPLGIVRPFRPFASNSSYLLTALVEGRMDRLAS